MRLLIKSRCHGFPCFALYAGLFLVAANVHAIAQESQAQETAELDRIGPWKLINTGIFVALLAWFLSKKGPQFFNARSADIQKAIKDATGLKIEADFRYSDIDKKMASLGAEVDKIREQARLEMEREHNRVRQQTEIELARIYKNASNEIEALRQEASDRVKLHTAQIALGLAERRLQDRFAAGEPDHFLGDFIHLVDRGKN
ncbi:MAG: ATP synthase F0 subunit B [Acidobacteriaceae bacterium]|nr:ATP synthase F0 subunit B [Acidobacteriaceae bacterium]